MRERDIEVELTDAARTLLGNLGYDPTYGARPLKRVIQKRLVDPLALAILEGRFVPGDTVSVDAADGEHRARARGGAAAARLSPSSAGRLTAAPRSPNPLACDVVNRRHSPGTPSSASVPRKLNGMFEPTTRSRTVPETSTWLGSARSAIRAPMWTVTPARSSPASWHSPGVQAGAQIDVERPPASSDARARSGSPGPGRRRRRTRRRRCVRIVRPR